MQKRDIAFPIPTIHACKARMRYLLIRSIHFCPDVYKTSGFREKTIKSHKWNACGFSPTLKNTLILSFTDSHLPSRILSITFM